MAIFNKQVLLQLAAALLLVASSSAADSGKKQFLRNGNNITTTPTAAPTAAVILAPNPIMCALVGGSNAAFNEYPFFTSWGSSCGATLIHDDILLTAAHVSFLLALMTGQVYINFLNGF